MPLFMNNPCSPAEASAKYPGSFWMRTAAARDVEGLAEYFSNLSQTSRYNRFMGAVNNFSKIALDCLVHRSEADRFTFLAELKERSGNAVIGEASCAFDRESGSGEFAISVSDRWQHHKQGLALLAALQFRAVSLGYFQLFGETLTINVRMKRLARRGLWIHTLLRLASRKIRQKLSGLVFNPMNKLRMHGQHNLRQRGAAIISEMRHMMDREPNDISSYRRTMPRKTCDTAWPSGAIAREVVVTSKSIVLRFVAFIGITLLSLAGGVPMQWLSEMLDMSVLEFRGFSMFVIFASLWLTHAIATSDSVP
jgi:hypothetical protein